MKEIEQLLQEYELHSGSSEFSCKVRSEIKEHILSLYQSLQQNSEDREVILCDLQTQVHTLQQERDSCKKKLEEVKQILDGNEGKYAQEAVGVCDEALKGNHD